VSATPARPVAGQHVFEPLFKGEHPSGACAWDWGPTPALANQLLYTENTSGGSAVYRVAEGGTHPGTKLHTFSDLNYQLLHDLRWLPDGSGFLYSQTNPAQDSANIFRYDFATRRATPLTRLEGEFARRFDVSPDGAWVVFERSRAADDDKDVDLWLVRADGEGARLLVRGGLAPSWR
jgi:Tol biopolymer transport system component